MGNLVFAGQSGKYITLADGALAGEEIDATGVSFGDAGTIDSVSEGLAVEDKITHALDDASLGFVRVMTDNVFVTQSSGSIQRGIDAAAEHDDIFIGTGTYQESDIRVDKPVTIDGAGATRGDVRVVPALASSPTGGFLSTGVHNAFILESGDVAIRDITIDGDGGVGGTGSRNYRGGIVTNYNVGGIFNDITVDNSVIANVYDLGIYLDGGDGLGSGFAVTGNYIHDVGGGNQGLGILIGSTSGSIANNQIDNTVGAIGANSWYGSAVAPLLSITGNSITGAAVGMNLASLADGSVIGGSGSARNTIDLSGNATADIGILATFAQGQVTIDNNRVIGSGGDTGIALYYDTDPLKPVLVTNNVLSTTGSDGATLGQGAGIFMTDQGSVFGEPSTAADYATITGNTVTGFAVGVQVDSRAGETVSAEIGGSEAGEANAISGGDVGIEVSGGDATVTRQRHLRQRHRHPHHQQRRRRRDRQHLHEQQQQAVRRRHQHAWPDGRHPGRQHVRPRGHRQHFGRHQRSGDLQHHPGRRRRRLGRRYGQRRGRDVSRAGEHREGNHGCRR